MVRWGEGYGLRPKSDPGEVWYGEVVAVLRSGRHVRLRRSYSQFRGDDTSLKQWADAVRIKLVESR